MCRHFLCFGTLEDDWRLCLCKSCGIFLMYAHSDTEMGGQMRTQGMLSSRKRRRNYRQMAQIPPPSSHHVTRQSFPTMQLSYQCQTLPYARANPRMPSEKLPTYSSVVCSHLSVPSQSAVHMCLLQTINTPRVSFNKSKATAGDTAGKQIRFALQMMQFMYTLMMGTDAITDGVPFQ